MRKKLSKLLIAMMLFTIVPVGTFSTGTSVAKASKAEQSTVVNEDSLNSNSIMPSKARAVDAYAFSMKQKKANYTDVEFKLLQSSALKKVADTVKVEVTMKYDGNITQRVTKSYKVDSSVKNIKFPTFGRFDIKLFYINKGKVVKTKTDKMNIIANEYNLAPIVATFPVVYFSLNLHEITKTSSGEPIPTFVSLQRPDAYNWDNLPQNVYWQPNLTKKQVQTQTSFDVKSHKFADYVKTLHDANPNAKFNLYINDAYSRYIVRLLCANGIKEENFKVVLLSDGSGSYAHFKNVFGGKDAEDRYQKMKSGWEAVKENAYKTGKEDISLAPYYTSSRYATMLANEYSNIEWWVARKSDTFESGTEGFVDKYVKSCDAIKVKNMNDMLKALDEKETIQFKKLYNFNNQMFKAAEEHNKKVMMILGSRTTMEPQLGNFSAYAKFLMKHYGDEFEYYYKGHPATPTKLHPSKQKELANLKITDVESSIPAELILFFYPDIYMAGYSSSTFNSVQKDEMATGVFGKTKKEALNDTSLQALAERDAFNFYMKQSKDVSQYPGTNNSHDNYIIDFSNKYLNANENKYEVAVYDYNNDLLMYYKNINGKYEVVDIDIDLKSVSGMKSDVDVDKLTLKASWDNVEGAEGYELKYKTKYNGAWKTKVINKNSVSFTKLKKGQTLEWKVRPYMTFAGKKFYGDYSSLQKALILDKNHSTTLSYGKKTITVKWSKTKNSYGKVKYKVYYKKNNGKWNTKVTDKTSLKLSKIKISDVYEIKVVPQKVVAGSTYTGESGNKSYRYVRTASLKSLKAKNNAFEVRVNKAPKVTGYEYIYATNKNFKNSKYKTAFKASNTKTTVSKLANKKTYYVKVRAYKIIDGKKYVGSYGTKILKIKTK